MYNENTDQESPSYQFECGHNLLLNCFILWKRNATIHTYSLKGHAYIIRCSYSIFRSIKNDKLSGLHRQKKHISLWCGAYGLPHDIFLHGFSMVYLKVTHIFLVIEKEHTFPFLFSSVYRPVIYVCYNISMDSEWCQKSKYVT